ncbi:cysteine hydrolase family protein [Agromyces archimandritae]|uniref:Cysteine hydrolase n=1 Tax=Agromyces archimandritae TaxID=2781962 RepID=A0A975FLD0_9MICO|nr:cysteine hydrolase family protein [Agromyces archimandritae]QTX04064.1 cysteine hydrolase [Agromyces archimandritae]
MPDRPELARNAALVVIDVQRGFADPSWGRPNNPDAEANLARLLAAWADAGRPVVLVRHDSRTPGSPLAPGTAGNAFADVLDGVTGDLLVTKHVNSAFIGEPSLEAWLTERGIRQIVVCGIQTNMCVETTARMGGNLGFDVIVPMDATRTFDLAAPGGPSLTADELARATAVNLAGGGFARVVETASLV